MAKLPMGWCRSWDRRTIVGAVADCLSVVSIVMIAWALAAAHRGRAELVSPSGLIPPGLVALPDNQLGDNDLAQVMILQFTDFECPYSAKAAARIVRMIEDEYVANGHALFALRHLPLESIHPLAFQAAEAVQCAGREKKFWQMHDRLFAGPGGLGRDALRGHASALQLDVAAFEECLGGLESEQVRRDMAQAVALSIAGTPTFLIGFRDDSRQMRVLRRIDGVRPLSVFRTAIDQTLADVRDMRAHERPGR